MVIDTRAWPITANWTFPVPTWPPSALDVFHKNALYKFTVITGPSIWPVLFCSLVSVVCRRCLLYVTLPAGGRAGRRARGGRAADTAR